MKDDWLYDTVSKSYHDWVEGKGDIDIHYHIAQAIRAEMVKRIDKLKESNGAYTDIRLVIIEEVKSALMGDK